MGTYTGHAHMHVHEHTQHHLPSAYSWASAYACVQACTCHMCTGHAFKYLLRICVCTSSQVCIYCSSSDMHTAHAHRYVCRHVCGTCVQTLALVDCPTTPCFASTDRNTSIKYLFYSLVAAQVCEVACSHQGSTTLLSLTTAS